MSRRALVKQQGKPAAYLEERADGSFRFTYLADYLANEAAPAVSLTLPKRRESYESETLFAFFYGLLSEGSTRTLQARTQKVDERDLFGLLLATGSDTVGSVTVIPANDDES